MPNVDNLIDLFERMAGRHMSVHQQRCVLVRNRNAACSRCADVCTSGCISYHDNELSIAPEKCIGCGTCATACPTCALEARDPNDGELYDTAVAAMQACDGTAVLACEQILAAAGDLCDNDKVTAVKCLGRVDESLALDLATSGAREIVLVQGACNECPYRTGLDMARDVRDTANALLETWGSGVRVRVAEKFPRIVRRGDDKDYDERRRRFFASVRDDAKEIAAIPAEQAMDKALGAGGTKEPRYLKVAADGTLPHFVPDRRERLLDDLAELGEPADELITTRLWGHVIIDLDACTSCRMCATFCPTGAIARFDREDGTFGVEHAPSDCVKCRCCENICPAHALTLSDEVFAVDLLKGVVEQYEMRPIEHPKGTPKSILYSLRGLLATDQLYER